MRKSTTLGCGMQLLRGKEPEKVLEKSQCSPLPKKVQPQKAHAKEHFADTRNGATPIDDGQHQFDNATMSDTMQPRDPEPSRRTNWPRIFLYMVVVGSLGMNFLLCGLLGFRQSSRDDELSETRLWGDDSAKAKIAVIRIEGVLMDGMTDYYLKQIEQAAADDKVKAIVVRID